MIVIELDELLCEWWLPLSTNPSRADQSNTRRLDYTVRGGIEAGGRMKCPRTGLGYTNKNSAVRVAADFFQVVNTLKDFLTGG